MGERGRGERRGKGLTLSHLTVSAVTPSRMYRPVSLTEHLYERLDVTERITDN